VVAEAHERVLIEAAQAGDLDAFEVLVRRHQRPVYRLALRMLGSASDAEDVAQETFVQAWRSIGRFRGSSSLGTWLYRIATNRCLDLLAADRPTEPLDAELGDQLGDPVTALAQRERLRSVMAGLHALSGDQRAALVLREFEGLRYDQIAEVLGITVAAVKGRIHRARLALLATLGEDR